MASNNNLESFPSAELYLDTTGKVVGTLHWLRGNVHNKSRDHRFPPPRIAAYDRTSVAASLGAATSRPGHR